MRAADDAVARHETDEARILAVVAAVAEHQVLPVRHDDRAERAQHRSCRQQHDRVRALGQILGEVMAILAARCGGQFRIGIRRCVGA